MKKLIISVTMLAALSACTSMDDLGLSEDKYQHAWVDKNIIVGKTTMAQVKAIYGEPFSKSGNGLNDTWYYKSAKRAAGTAVVHEIQGKVRSMLPGAAQSASVRAEGIGGPAVKELGNDQVLRISFKRGLYDGYY